MARWILFRDLGAHRPPCELARCEAPDWARAVDALARFAGDRSHIEGVSPSRGRRVRAFFVRSVVSLAEDAAARRLLARPFTMITHAPRRRQVEE
ncbi:MAG: hypothetical protein IPF87_22940 [Gemmatimonadetes bacterium]|nr:hypothetical protein [Gemmatimonadota bacterium]